MKFLAFIIFIVFVFFHVKVSFAERIIDLGTYGFVCKIDRNKIAAAQIKKIKKTVSYKNFVSNIEINPNYNSSLSFYKGGKDIRRFKLKNRGFIKQKQKIFVFAVDDPLSRKMVKNINVDYGVCIKYNSLKEVEDFRTETGFNRPIQLGNDDLVSFLHLTNYPAVVTIENGGIIVETGV